MTAAPLAPMMMTATKTTASTPPSGLGGCERASERASERARASYAKMRTQKPVATSGRQSRGRRRRREGPVSDDAGMHARRPTDRRHLAPRARDETGWRRRRRWGERMSGDPLRGEGSARDPKEEERGGGERERPHRRSVAGPFPALAGLPPPGLLLGRLLPPPFARRRRRRRAASSSVRPSAHSSSGQKFKGAIVLPAATTAVSQ